MQEIKNIQQSITRQRQIMKLKY